MNSIVRGPISKLEIGKLRNTIWPTHRMRFNCLVLAQGAKKGLKQVNGVLLKPRRGAFEKSVRWKLKKVVFFRDRKHFPRRSVCQSGARIGHRQKKRGCKSWKCGSFVLQQEEAKKKANWIILLGFAQSGISQKIYNNRRQVLAPTRFPAAGSKIIIFLIRNQGFCAAGEIRTS